MICAVADPNFGQVLHPGIVPKISGSEPGGISWPGPDVGAHTDHILGDLLGMSATDIQALRAEQVI